MVKITDKEQIASNAYNAGWDGEGSQDMCTRTYEDDGVNWEIWADNWNRGRRDAVEEFATCRMLWEEGEAHCW